MTYRMYSIMVIVPILLFFAVVFPKHIKAEVLFKDDFTTDLSAWENVVGEKTDWKVIQGHLEGLVTAPFSTIQLVPSSRAWNPDWKNYEFQLDYTPLTGADRNIVFWYQSPNTWYQAHFVNSYFNLVKFSSGQVIPSFNFLINKSITNSRTYRIKGRLNNGHVKIYVNGELFADYTDTSFSNNYGPISLKVTTGSVYPTKILFDNVIVRTLDDTDIQLSVPLFKQTDLIWKDFEYDSASKWSTDANKIGIGDWGCALSSLAMILNFHGITNLPTGSVINPSTLNSWLSSQPDGYLGDGLVNWIAATRLTKEISAKKNTPVLEYQYLSSDLMQVSRENIMNNRPVIFEIPGHFIVGSGYSSINNDFLINDPAFPFLSLNEHKIMPVSGRLFTPSYTDLSYILIVSDPNLSIKILDQFGKVLPTVQDFEEYLSIYSFESLTLHPQNKSIMITQLPKPESGTYYLTISQNKKNPYNLSVWAYDQQAIANKIDVSGQELKEQFEISYVKEAASTQLKTTSCAD